MGLKVHRLALSSFAWLACQFAATDRADAQLGTRPIQGPSRPTTSPYLGLLNNGGNSPGLNYYTQVRPQRHCEPARRLCSRKFAMCRSRWTRESFTTSREFRSCRSQGIRQVF
jgi:hypothetical protein